jgi:carbon-monoxide dehydrogenase medium subunit
VAETKAGVQVAITGAAPTVFRATAFEAALAKQLAPAALDGIPVAEDDLLSDNEVSTAYRAHLVTVIAKRAVAAL